MTQPSTSLPSTMSISTRHPLSTQAKKSTPRELLTSRGSMPASQLLVAGSDQLSWTDGNLSTYLTDSGLWTACHESRQRMLRHFRPSETSPQLSKRMPVDWEAVRRICEKPTASINMEFLRDNGERQYLTIRPSADLLCLHQPQSSNISWDHWHFLQDFPLFRWRSHEWHWESSYIMNVAVEYDPAWEKLEYGPFVGIKNGFSQVDGIHGLKTF